MAFSTATLDYHSGTLFLYFQRASSATILFHKLENRDEERFYDSPTATHDQEHRETQKPATGVSNMQAASGIRL